MVGSVPYRSDARGDEAGRRRRVAEARARLERADLRCRAAAGALAHLRDRIARRRRELDAAVAEAERDRRRVVHAGLAAAGGEHARLRAALRTRGAVAALEAAMARARGASPLSRAEGPPPEVGEIERRLTEARRARARLTVEQGPALERAQARLADAVAERDEAAAELDAARERLEALARKGGG
jgi:hypothetical protein